MITSGQAVSMNAAGDRVNIGAYHNDGNGTKSGHVRIYLLLDRSQIALILMEKQRRRIWLVAARTCRRPYSGWRA